MKNLFKSLMLVAVAAMGLTSCSKEAIEDVVPEVSKIQMTVTAEQSRTYLDEENDCVQWSATGEQLAVFQLVEGETAPTNATSNSYTKDANDGTAKFGVAFDAIANATGFTYSAVYPATAANVSGNDNLESVKVITPTTQTPTPTSFDSAADLMIAKAITSTTQPTELSMQFKRVVAIAKMTLTNLEADGDLVSVTFEATDKVLTGRSRFNLLTGEVVEYGYYDSSPKVELNYSGIAATTPIYFTCLPAELAAGDSFTVTASTLTTKYSRTVTLSKALNFKEGKMSTFSVNMATATTENIADFSGTYAIFAKLSDGSCHIMTNDLGTASTERYQSVNYGAALPEAETTLPDDRLWQIEKIESTGTYHIYSLDAVLGNAKYLGWDGGNSGTLVGLADAKEFNITKNGDTYTIQMVSNTSRYLARNSTASNAYFAFYAGSQEKNLYLIPAEQDKTPVIIPASTKIEIAAAGVENQTLEVTCTNFDAADLSVEKDAAATWLTILYSNGTITYSATENTTDGPRKATVTLSAEGAEDVVITITQPAAGTGVEQTVTFIFKDYGLTNGVSYTDFAEGDIALKFAQGTNASLDPKYYDTGNGMRMYEGNTLTISGGNISKIVITCSSAKYAKLSLNTSESGALSLSDAVYTWTNASGDSEVVFKGSGTGRYQKIEVTYTAE